MNNTFRAVVLTHKTAPIEIRELVALSDSLNQHLVANIKEWEDTTDILVLSTCNRTEVYYSSEIDYSHAIIREVLSLKGIYDPIHYHPYFQVIHHTAQTSQHLFEVAIGLDSQVIGDMQITNQVKKAYQLSADLDVAGPFLHRLLHSIFFTNKRVVQETPFRSGAASTSYATVELMEELSSQMLNPKVLIVGLGEIGADVCRNLMGSAMQNITIANRTFEKAQTLATECGFQTIPFEQVFEAIHEADFIVSSVPVENFIDKSFLQSLQTLSFKFFIDLSIPRSVEAEELPGILVYHIDQISNRASEALQKRLNAIPHVQNIIQESLADFLEWTKEMEISPTIQKLKNALEQIRQEEIARYVKKLDEKSFKQVDDITKNMMQKIIKLPALHLKAACKRGEAETLIDVLNDLFNLEKVS
jgi:glutamyl-tRNA reductase